MSPECDVETDWALGGGSQRIVNTPPNLVELIPWDAVLRMTSVMVVVMVGVERSMLSRAGKDYKSVSSHA
jgi:hypothetical protein